MTTWSWSSFFDRFLPDLSLVPERPHRGVRKDRQPQQLCCAACSCSVSLFSCHRFMRRSVWPSNFSNVYLLLESVSGIEPMSAETMHLRSNHQSMGDHPPQHDREKKRGSGLYCRKPESEPRLQAPDLHCSAPAVCVAFIAFCRLGCRVLNIRENVYLLL